MIQYESFLKNRIKDIEKVISKHFLLLHETLRNILKQSFEKTAKRRQEAGIVLSLEQQVKIKEEEDY